MDYRQFLDEYLALMDRARAIPLACYDPPEWPTTDENSPVALIVSAHPDDEVLTGMPIGIRLRREGWRLINLAMTLGRPGQRDRRRFELSKACAYLGIECVMPGEDDLNAVIESTGQRDWEPARAMISNALKRFRPAVVITHHSQDGHPDHSSVCMLVREELGKTLRPSYVLVEGEYWKDMDRPNVQLEVAPSELEVLLKALSFHEGELVRNRYDLFWPPFMHVNARYGEVVTGWGTPAAEFPFSVMYRISRFRDGYLVRDKDWECIPASTPLSQQFV